MKTPKEMPNALDELILGVTKRVMARERRRITRLVKRLRKGRMARTWFQKSRRNDGLPERAYSLACDDFLKALKGQP
jgi:hypothetical protein